MASPIDYIRSESARFRSLASTITQLQHRAALSKIAATKAGNTQMASDMAATITRLGTIRNLHASAVAKLDDLNTVLAKVGFPDNYLGVLPVVPVAVIAAATAVVAVMIAVYHKTSVESDRLALAEQILGNGSGVPTKDQIAKLNALTNLSNSAGASEGVGGVVGTLLKPLALGIAVVVVGPKLLDMVGKRR